MAAAPVTRYPMLVVPAKGLHPNIVYVSELSATSLAVWQYGTVEGLFKIFSTLSPYNLGPAHGMKGRTSALSRKEAPQRALYNQSKLLHNHSYCR
jgi:hypothetical protein